MSPESCYQLSRLALPPSATRHPGDNFSPQGSHVLPALIQQYYNAAHNGDATVTNWGTGSPRREFLHVDDMAAACIHLLENYDGPQQVNVGTGSDVTIKEIAETIAHVVGFTGTTDWDTSKPDGTPQKRLDVSKLADAGWIYSIGLEEGLRSTVDWFEANIDHLRVAGQ